MIAGLLATAVLLVVNGLFVASEFSLISSRRSRVQQLAEQGDGRAALAWRSLGELGLMLSAAQIGITLCNLLLGAVAEPTMASVVTPLAEAVGLPTGTAEVVGLVAALLFVVFLVMVFGEMVPKYVAIADPERVLLVGARPFRAWAGLARPVVRALTTVRNALLGLLGLEAPNELAEGRTGEEIAGLLAESRREGLLPEVEHRLLRGALDLPNRPVSSVMVDRSAIVAVSAGMPPAVVARAARESGHARIVVLGRDLDDVLGYVHAKDLLRLDDAAQHRPVPVGMVRQMLVVPPERKLDDLLVAMRASRTHLALVRRPDGRTAGICTLEDVIEALVGTPTDLDPADTAQGVPGEVDAGEVDAGEGAPGDGAPADAEDDTEIRDV